MSGGAPGTAWPAPRVRRPVQARIRVPGSKSQTNRALVLAALAGGASRIGQPLRSRDTLLMADGLRALGVRVGEDGPDLVVEPGALRGGGTVDCGNAGTVARFLPALAALADGPVSFVGDARMSERPLGALLTALRGLGGDVEGDRIPLRVLGRGRVAGGRARLDASASSQLVSGLLLAAARFEQGLLLEHVGPPVPSAPHLAMTVSMLGEHGVDAERDGDTWRVAPGPVRAVDRRIEPDLSTASAFLAAAVATGGRVLVEDWPTRTEQPGRLLPALLEAMGATIGWESAALSVTGPERLTGLDADLRDCPEAVPALTALALLASGPSRFTGVGHLRFQETDRLAALAEEFGRLGARIEVLPDGLAVTPAPLTGGVTLDPRADHRLAMAYAVVGLRVEGVSVSSIETTGKTLPDFPDRWAALVAGAA